VRIARALTGLFVQELEVTLKELRKQHEAVNSNLTKRSSELKVLQEEHAKATKAHQEAVQESVTARMAQRKLEEQLAGKTAEATAENSKAAEASRLLQALRRDFNESSLKSAPHEPSARRATVSIGSQLTPPWLQVTD
jgi:chromosome segregation ATPase